MSPQAPISTRIGGALALVTLLLLPAQRVMAQESPPLSAQNNRSDEADLPDWLFDPSVQVGLFTTAGGILGGAGICAIAFLSPACCGIWLGLPFGALGTALGTLIGVAIVDDWSCGAMILPIFGSLAVGAIAGLGASIVAVVVAQVIGANLNVVTTDAGIANLTQNGILTAASTSALVTMTLGAALAGLGAGLIHKIQSSRPRQAALAREKNHEAETQPVAGRAMAY